MDWITYIFYVIGLVVACRISSVLTKKEVLKQVKSAIVGKLVITKTDEEAPYIFLDISKYEDLKNGQVVPFMVVEIDGRSSQKYQSL